MKSSAVLRWKNAAEAASEHVMKIGGVRVPVPLILGVIHQESRGDPKAVSHSGAQGLMQLMPATAKSLGVEDAFDPEDNIRGGTLYLGRLLKRFLGRLDLVSAAYNAGPSAVERAGNAIPNIAETKKYVPLVLQYMKDYSA